MTYGFQQANISEGDGARHSRTCAVGSRLRPAKSSCGGCRTLWHWRRVGCPYCGNVDLEKIHILEFDGKQTIRLDVCNECGAYLKTYGEDDEENIYLRDWTTLHLDLLAEEKIFTSAEPSNWNNFLALRCKLSRGD